MIRLLAALFVALSAAVPGTAAGAADSAAQKPYTRNVAIVLYENVQPLDWTGPYEVYNDAGRFGEANGQPAFRVYTVSKTADVLDGQGLRITPNYSIENAPRPDIVVFPGGPAGKIHDDPVFFAWAAKAAREAEIAQSVCTGAFVLAKAGLLDGLEVTTFYGAIASLQQQYPKVMVKDGRRFVDNGRIVTTAGISAGIDGSLHVVARLLGRRIADQVARYMEYHWSPDAFLARDYAYWNQSTDARGRLAQGAQMQMDEKNYAEALKAFRALVADDPGSRAGWRGVGYALKAMKQHGESAEALARSVDGDSSPHAAHMLYVVAGQYALAGRTDDAVQALEKAFALGYSDRVSIEKDPDLAAVRNDPRLRKLIAVR
jgi:transcriptional regulator GlxA family with amidase domain